MTGSRLLGVIAILVGALMVWTGIRNYKLGAALTGKVVQGG